MARGRDARLWLLVAGFNLVLLYGVGVVAQPILRWSEGAPPGKAELVGELRAEGIRAYPSVSAASFLDRREVDPRLSRERLSRPMLDGVAYQPLSGLPGVRTVCCKEDEGWLVYEADEWGFNNAGRMPDGTELLVVGDSYVQGVCVPVGTAFVDLLDRKGRRVYSLGLGSSGPLITLAQLKEYAHRVDAPNVLWVFTASNDVMRNKPRASDLDVELEDPLLLRYLEAKGPLQQLPLVLPRLAAQIEAEIDERLTSGRVAPVSLGDDLRLVELRARLFRLGVSAWHAFPPARASRIEWYRRERLPVLQAILEEASRYLATLGKRLFVVYLPTRKPHVLKEDFLGVFEAVGLPTLDLEMVLDPTEDLFASAGSHFTIEGNRRVAEAIDRALASWLEP